MLGFDGFPDDDQALAGLYNEHVKNCVRAKLEPMKPTDWYDSYMIIAGREKSRPLAALHEEISKLLHQEQVDASVTFVQTNVVENETEVRAAFTAMMIDHGINQKLSPMALRDHYSELGMPRPATKKQTEPCTMCGNILCAWAR